MAPQCPEQTPIGGEDGDGKGIDAVGVGSSGDRSAPRVGGATGQQEGSGAGWSRVSKGWQACYRTEKR